MADPLILLKAEAHSAPGRPAKSAAATRKAWMRTRGTVYGQRRKLLQACDEGEHTVSPEESQRCAKAWRSRRKMRRKAHVSHK